MPPALCILTPHMPAGMILMELHNSGRGGQRPRQMAVFSCPKNVYLSRGQCAHVQGESLKVHWHDLGRVVNPRDARRFTTPVVPAT